MIAKIAILPHAYPSSEKDSKIGTGLKLVLLKIVKIDKTD
jgi:hypothetical protein